MMTPLPRELELRIFELMVLTRLVEERMNLLASAGSMRERPHASIGQEAVGVASAISLRQEDWVLPSLRARAVFITKGVPLRLIFAEAFAKRTGVSGGKWTSHHMAYPPAGVLLGSAVVGSSIPVAVGVALAQRYKGLDTVTVAYFGEGATSRGDFHEGVNLAAVLQLPIVFLCENNLYAISTPLSRQMNIKDVAERALAYGIPAATINGNDASAVYHATAGAVERARTGLGPSFIECQTYRWRGHSELYPPEQGRSKEELASWMARCPIRHWEALLRQAGSLDDARVAQVYAEAQAQIDEAVDWARGAPDPEPADLYRHVYAGEGS